MLSIYSQNALTSKFAMILKTKVLKSGLDGTHRDVS